ncbi:MAG: hypothetical protein ABW223_08955 [Rariglobus sp.]
MPRLTPFFLLRLCALISFSSAVFAAEEMPVVQKAGQPGQAFKGVPAAASLDPQAFAEWVDGRETVIGEASRERSPTWVVWTPTTTVGHSGFVFGGSKNPGPRHLRIGFKDAIRAGTILVNGGGVLGVLKPGAPYPGDLGNEAHWQPASRLLEDGTVSSSAVERNSYGLWVLPPATSVRALRLTQTPSATEAIYQGWVGAVLVTEERLANLATYAQASARSNTKLAAALNNGQHESWSAWENRRKNDPVTDAEPVLSDANAEWVLLTWGRPVKVDGLAAFWMGFEKAEVQTYAGPDDRHPRDAFERDWKTIGVFSDFKSHYPRPMAPNRLSFGREITTRAIRLRIVATGPEEDHGHLKGNRLAGRRTWLGELMALRSLGDAPLQPLAPPVVVDERPHPPIPVKFTLKEPGYVTLVIERADGMRVRNLVSETFFPAGENTAWWDGTDDLGRDIDAAKHGIYRIPSRFVEPGDYRVRGLVRGKITPVYEFSVYTTGSPPWGTADHTGAWLANHSPPSAAAFVPAERSPTGEPVVYLGCYVTEGPDGLAWVDLDGRKRGGKKWIGGTWTAAPYLAFDAGAKADKGVHVYVASVWETGKRSGESELRVTAITPAADKPVLVKKLDELTAIADAATAGRKAGEQIGGLAVHDGVVVVSLHARNELLFIRASDGTALGTKRLDAPRGLAFDAQGRLLALTGSKLVRFDSIADVTQLSPVDIVTGLDAPIALTTDSRGRILVSDQGASHQVKIFNADGKPAGTIGKAGAPKAGSYDPLRMQNPAGITLDSKGQLWVTEDDYLPKRVSVWSLDGKLVNAFYGPGKYGGGGALDATDKTKFYYADEGHGAMEFKLDWAKGSYELQRVYYRPLEGDLKLPFRAAGPETALYHAGRRYFTNAYNSSPTGGHSTATLFVDRDGLARPAVMMGRASDWALLKDEAFRVRWPEGVDLNAKQQQYNQAFFIWTDNNGDEQAQPDEVVMSKASAGGFTVGDELAFCIARFDGKTVRFSPVSIADNGNPRYDLAKVEVLASGVHGPASSGGNQALVAPDGWTAVTLGMEPFSSHSVTGAKDGVAKWSYPNLWPGLHASHEAPPPEHPGQLIGPTRLLGGLMKSRIGPLWAVNSNHGCFYVFTSDGLFVATVFEDMRLGKRWQMPVAKRGMSLEGLTLNDENFWPTIAQLPDGTVYLVDGGRSSLVRIDGLNNLTRLPDSRLTLTNADLDKSRAYLVEIEAARQKAQGTGVLPVIGRFTAPAVDGKLDDWPATNWVDIDQRGVRAYFNSDSKPYNVTGSVAVAGGRLYAAWRTGDARLLENSGEMPVAPFKTGGALDLMIGANPKADPARKAPVVGDVRLLITLVKDKPRALLYRPVVPGTAEGARIPFSSPWRTITFDRVDDVTDQIQFAGQAGSFEVSVPLDLLLLKPTAGTIIKGDIGILRGQGGATTSRIYWANKATGITADVPSEAMLTPGLWGDWEFKAETVPSPAPAP